jgi:hypothetical protein
MSTPAIIRWDQAYSRNGDGKLPRAVVHVIRTYMDNDTLAGFVKRETLARDTGLSLRQVDRHIAANVAAGWLEITDQGNSSGKANDYRLTFPDRDTSVTAIETDMSTDRDGYVSPTSPSTSPRNFSRSSEERTSPEVKGDISVAIPDPFSGSGDYLPAATTSPWDEDGYVSLPNEDRSVPFTDAEIEALLAEHYAEAQDTPQQRLLDVIRADGPVGAKSDLATLMGVSHHEVNQIVPQMIRDGLVVHDTERGRLVLA